MYDYRAIYKEYENNVGFMAVMQAMYHMLLQAELTPEEMRKALHVALVKFEMDSRTYTARVISPNK